VSGDSWTLIAIAVVSLLVMAGAATVEASAGLISRHRFRQAASGSSRERSVQTLLDPRRSLVSALQLVQAIAIGLAASLITFIILRQGGWGPVVIAVLVTGTIFLFFGQAVPRALARTRPSATAGVLLSLCRVVATLVRPLSALSDGAADLFTRLLGGEHPDTVPAGSEDELLIITRDDSDDGVIEPEERRMIDNVLRLEDTTARDIMVPRVDIVAVAEDASSQDIVDAMTEKGHSRLPVYRESIDEIVGILYAKDLLPFVIGSTRMLPIKQLLRPAYLVPESKRLDDLLGELRRNRVHIAVVSDEYGGTAGLVTIEDILEEIVGEIQDEFDPESRRIEIINDNEAIADGALSIDDLSDEMEIEWPEQVSGTIGGYIQRQLGRIPSEGEVVQIDGIRLTVLAVEHRRVRQVRVEHRLHDAEQAADEESVVSPSA
jgi:putative hemolysin